MRSIACLLMAFAAAAGAEPFSEAEVRAILAHGPWPMPGTSDPRNAASGRREAIELGQRLFFDPRLSAERSPVDNRALTPMRRGAG